MQEPHIEGLATHDDPEPCIDSDREGAGEASAGARPGPVWSREITYSRAPTPLSEVEGHTDRARQGERSAGPARSETRGTGGTFLRENREIPVLPGAEAAPGRGGDGGKEPGQGEGGRAQRTPDAGPGQCVKGARPRTGGSQERQGSAIHCPPPPRRCRTAGRGVARLEEGRGPWRRRRDVGAVLGGAGSEPSRAAGATAPGGYRASPSRRAYIPKADGRR